MLLNLQQDVKEVVEVSGNRIGQKKLFEMLFSKQDPVDLSFIRNDNISIISTQSLDIHELAKWDSGMLTTGKHITHICQVDLKSKTLVIYI